jgi:hypothetical protein
MNEFTIKADELEPVTLADHKRESREKEYNGHKNWTHWNVSLWLDNDEHMYRHIQDIIKRHLAGQVRYNTFTKICRIVQNSLPKATPDGARYSMVAIAAHMEREVIEARKYLAA